MATTDCTNLEDRGTSGWSNWPPPIDDEEKWCGCGRIYDCCAVIVPVACVGTTDCSLYKSGVCKIKPPEQTEPDIWEEKIIMYIHEYLFKTKFDKDHAGLYGHDWQLPKAERPPILSQIPDLDGE